jgi:hypothetical protein
MKNLHLVASMFVGEVDKCLSFFDQSFIRDADPVDDEEVPMEPTV